MGLHKVIKGQFLPVKEFQQIQPTEGGKHLGER